MTRPPPTAPLFPYTTLFRSHSTWPGLLTDVRAFELPRRMLRQGEPETCRIGPRGHVVPVDIVRIRDPESGRRVVRSEEHTSELQSPMYLVCRLLLEKKKNKN